MSLARVEPSRHGGQGAAYDLTAEQQTQLALRNHDGVATTGASIDAGRLSGPARSVLAQSRFLFRPDDEHLRNSPQDVRQDAPAPVLFGTPDRPYLRVDPPYMSAVDGDEEAAAGLGELADALERYRVSLRLQPGDVLFVDNFQVVHGRPSFTARLTANAGPKTTGRRARALTVGPPDAFRPAEPSND